MQYLTSEQMRKVDEIAVKKYKIKIEQMMEKAGKNLAEFVAKLKPKKVIVLYGKGNNGGGGLVAAKYLSKSGIKVDDYFKGKTIVKLNNL